MKRPTIIMSLMVLSMPFLSAQVNVSYDKSESFCSMAMQTMNSIYEHYTADSTLLLRENFPFDEAYEATYLATQNESNVANKYSYLWPYAGFLSAMVAIYDINGDSTILRDINSRVLPGLDLYFDDTRSPAAFSSYIKAAPISDRFYDDNIWLGIDMADLYRLTSDTVYLDRAKTIWKFIESGMDDMMGGGIYWCEQRKLSKNTCSSAPAAVLALKLFDVTKDSIYLDEGIELYSWTKGTLRDAADGLYFDNINIHGRINKAKFAYNSGQMLQAASLLYKLTSDSIYLDDAESLAATSFNHFLNGGEAKDFIGTFMLFSAGDIWFDAVMTRGFNELYDIDKNPCYLDVICRNLEYAWENMRDNETGLFNNDWSLSNKDDIKWLLPQAAFTEMFARAASYQKN